MRAARLPVLLALSSIFAGIALAQNQSAPPAPGAPGVITEGSSTVSIGQQGAARKGDRTDGGGSVVEGSKDVFINGRPAATTGDRTDCGGIAIGGGSNVFINGKPVARAGDMTSGCPGK